MTQFLKRMSVKQLSQLYEFLVGKQKFCSRKLKLKIKNLFEIYGNWALKYIAINHWFAASIKICSAI